MNQSVVTIPVPSKRNLLHRLKALELPISEIVDVGVREKTGELIEAFPGHLHHLFEPVNTFFPDIERNYANVPHVLYPISLSDRDETKYLSVTSLLRDGVATHSRIVDQYILVDGQEVISCAPIDVRRFDSLSSVFNTDFLLKVDVDGFDLEVLKGFGSKLELASIVVIEATYHNWLQRAGYLEQNGFQLLDIVDLVYYGDTLYQFDLAFIRRNLVSSRVRPPINLFERPLWRPFHP
jgi:FkbM family methyltransferase